MVLYVAVYTFFYKVNTSKSSSFGTSPIIDASSVYNGYLLISPYNRLLAQKPEWKGSVYLLDMNGKPVHTWSTNMQVLYSLLEPDGKLLSVAEQARYSKLYPPGGNTGTIQERDWNSNITWEYKNDAMHHDIAPLPNGNLAVALWEPTPPDIATQVEGGVKGTELPGGLIWSDKIIEINRDKKIVWSWDAWQHLDPTIDVIGPVLPRYAWTYTNGLKYMAKNPIDGTPAYLVSMRSLSEVLIVRKSDGEIIWRSPKDLFNLQHDPTYLDNGDIMVFDNGLDRIPAPFAVYGSRAIEINPKTSKVVWTLDGGAGAIDKVRLFAAIVGGAQRLPNGNTLITDGPKGHIFEVTPGGKLVWDMISPYNTEQTGLFPNNFLFKARIYGENEIKWPAKIAPAFDSVAFNLHNLLSKIYPN